MRITTASLIGFAAMAWTGTAIAAEDTNWLQWGGPHRNFMVDSGKLADKWPEEGPSRLWKRELGDGYSTIIVDGDMLYTMYRPGEQEVEFTVALDAATGKTRWEHEGPSPITDLMKQFGPGPSSTPLIAGDRLVSIGTHMVVRCFDKREGQVLWERDLVADYDATVPGRGYSASPLLYGDAVLIPVGGKPGQTLVALNVSDGKEAWKTGDFDVTHSSPAIVKVNGREQIVLATKQDLVGFDPKSHELLWQVPLKPDGGYLSSPLWTGDDLVFISSAYGGGSHLVRLSEKEGKPAAEELWYDRKLRIHHGNAVRIGDHVYGSSGDFGPAFLASLAMKDGEMAWRERGFSKSTLVRADGKVIILDEDGNLGLARFTPEGVELLSRCKVAELYAWAAPTLVDGKLYVRDRKHIMAFSLR